MTAKPIRSADSCCFIEWLKPEEERHHPKAVVDGMEELIADARAGVCELTLSAFVLAEVRDLGDGRPQADKFRRLMRELAMDGGVYSLDARLALQAAELGRRLGIKSPDAVVLATAVAARAEVFYTLDERLLKVAPAAAFLRDGDGDGDGVVKPVDGFKIVKPGRA